MSLSSVTMCENTVAALLFCCVAGFHRGRLRLKEDETRLTQFCDAYTIVGYSPSISSECTILLFFLFLRASMMLNLTIRTLGCD
jgi:hypothetical protein